MFLVRLVVPPPAERNDFRPGFFPRKVIDYDRAEQLAREVERKGGQATIEQVKR